MAKRCFVRIKRQEAEAWRQCLRSNGVLAGDCKIVAEGPWVYFPITDERYIKDKGLQTCWREATPTKQRPSLKSVAELLPSHLQPLMVRAFDRVGHILIFRLPAELEEYGGRLGEALLKVHEGVRTVALDRGVTGPYRLRSLEVMAGEPSLETCHKEFGLQFKVDLGQAYFSPRLATERNRVVSRARPGERAVDMFAGVGPLALALARRTGIAKVIACEWNPAAVKWFKVNCRLNKVDPAQVEIRAGDVATTLKERAWADRVILNHPTGALDYLEQALGVVKQKGIVQLYLVAESSEQARLEAQLDSLLALHGRQGRIAFRRVHGYSTTEEVIAVDIQLI